MKKIFCTFLLLGNILFGQINEFDSLQNLLKQNPSDTIKLKIYTQLSELCDLNDIEKFANYSISLADKILMEKKGTLSEHEKKRILLKKSSALNNKGFYYHSRGFSNEALKYYQQALNIQKSINALPEMANSLNNIGQFYASTGEPIKAMKYHEESLAIQLKINDSIGIAYNYSNMGALVRNQGNIILAINYYNKSLKILEEVNDIDGILIAFYNIAELYQIQKDYYNAEKYFRKSIVAANKNNNIKMVALNLIKLGNIMQSQGNTVNAHNYYDSALVIHKSINDISGMATIYNYLGELYETKNEPTKSLEYYQLAIPLQKVSGNKTGVSNTFLNLARLYRKNKKFQIAERYIDSCMAVSENTSELSLLMKIELELSKLNSDLGNYKKSLIHFQNYSTLKDSILNKETLKASFKNSIKYEFDKKFIADSLKVVEEKKLTNAQFKQEKNTRYILFGGLILVAIFGIFIFNRYKITQKQKGIIELKEQETAKQKGVITFQKHLVEEKHKEITDSINYAERIQRALLASKKLLDENLNSSVSSFYTNRVDEASYFILFKPKAIVSGDFYWASKLSDGNFVLVTADSTGHGVPGAIMSIVNMASLKEVVIQGITSPDLILNETRRLVIENLKNDGSEEGGKDGMDGSLLSFDFKNNVLHCASANNSIWIIRTVNSTEIENQKELIEIKADRMPIGKNEKDITSFTLHTFNLHKDDVVYTLTDGYPDQFGGKNGKKFKSKQLQEILLSISHEPMEIQKQKLNDAFDIWKGDLEQVDDVTIIGIRI